MANIIDYIRKIFQKGQKNVPTASGVGYQRYVGEYPSYDEMQRILDRRTKITKSQIMSQRDARVSRILYKLASDTFAGGVRVQVLGSPNEAIRDDAIEIINGIVDIINQKGKGWTIAMLRDGDVFLEILPTENRVTDVRKLMTLITYSRMSEHGDLPLVGAYYQEHPYIRNKILAEFDSWQIVQISWQREDGEPYGNGIFFSSLGHYEVLSSAEKNLFIRRMVRAGKRLLHKVGTPEKPARWEQVEEYRRINANTLANPMDPVQDFWSNGLVDIKEIDSDRDIGTLNDIEYFEALLSIQAGVPKALLGREQDINRDVLEEQEEDYFRVISDISVTLEHGFRKLIDFALLLGGILPKSITYEFVWGNRDRSDAKERIEMALRLQQLGYSFRSIYEFLSLNQLDFTEELERIKEQVSDGTIPYGVNMRLDPLISTLKQGGKET